MFEQNLGSSRYPVMKNKAGGIVKALIIAIGVLYLLTGLNNAFFWAFDDLFRSIFIHIPDSGDFYEGMAGMAGAESIFSIVLAAAYLIFGIGYKGFRKNARKINLILAVIGITRQIISTVWGTRELLTSDMLSYMIDPGIPQFESFVILGSMISSFFALLIFYVFPPLVIDILIRDERRQQRLIDMVLRTEKTAPEKSAKNSTSKNTITNEINDENDDTKPEDEKQP